MNRQKSSPRFRFAGAALLLILLALVLPAVREGDSRLWMLAIVVPSALVLAVTLLARMFSLDRMVLTLSLSLCALGIAALAFSDPGGASAQALRCSAGLAVLTVGAVLVRSMRSCVLTSAVSAFLGLLLLAAGLFAPASGIPLTEAALALMLIAFSSLLTSQNPFAALLLGTAGTALLLARQEVIPALAWSLTFLLLLWAADGSLLFLLSGTALAALMVLGAVTVLKIPLTPAAEPVAAESPLLASWTVGLPASDDSVPLFSRLTEVYGPIFSGFSAMLFLPLVLRGTSIAGSARIRFHAVLAMGCALLTVLYTLPALLTGFGVLHFRAAPLPLFASSLPELCSWMFLQGLICGISGQNDADLAEDVHLAMLAK